MEHSLHIACKHFVEAIAPASPAVIRKKVSDALNTSQNGEPTDLSLEDNGEPEDSEGEDVDIEFSCGDALWKALALVRQVCIPSILWNFEHNIYWMQ
jgi:hypothetical protein